MPVDKNMPILIVDDQKTMLRINRYMLNQLGFTNIEDAADGVEAVEKINKKEFKLILSDWNMEPMDGLTFLKKIRSNAKTKDVTFVMVTAETKAENVVAAKKAGVTNYIIKPFNAETLKAKLATVIGKF